MSAALARWDAFLGQIETRHAQVIAEAEASARQFIASVASGGDVLPLSLQLGQVKARLQALETTIVETWQAKVDDAITGEGNSTAVRDAARDKGDAVRHRLDDQAEELESRMLAELARQRFSTAQAQYRPAQCGRCGGPLASPPSFRALEVGCSCGTRTIVEPSERMRSVAAVGTHALAQVAALAEWRAMRGAERAQRTVRPPCPLQLLVAYERSQIAYWRTYLAARSQFEPELARDPADEIRSRMDQWYRSHAEYEEEWVRAGRPRAQI